jgi:hypothetical protein
MNVHVSHAVTGRACRCGAAGAVAALAIVGAGLLLGGCGGGSRPGVANVSASTSTTGARSSRGRCLDERFRDEPGSRYATSSVSPLFPSTASAPL